MRTLLTSMAIMVLVVMVTLIWTVIFFLDQTMPEKSADFKLIIMEKWKVPSLLPITHADYLNPENPEMLAHAQGTGRRAERFHDLVLLWRHDRRHHRYVEGQSRQDDFFLCHGSDAHSAHDGRSGRFQPRPGEKAAGQTRRLLDWSGPLAALNKRVGERFKITSINYKGIDLEFEIVGELPPGRYDKSAIMNDKLFQ